MKIRLTIAPELYGPGSAHDGEDLHDQRTVLEITVDDGRAEMRNPEYEGTAQRSPTAYVTVGSEPAQIAIRLSVEAVE